MDGLSTAMAGQMQSIAGQKGISYETAVARYGWHNDFALMVGRIREASPNSVTSAGVAGDRGAWVSFSGAVPASAELEIADFINTHSPFDIETRPNKGYSERELATAIEVVHYGLLNRSDVADATTSFESGTITAKVLLEDGVPDSVLDELRSVASQKLVDSTRADIVDHITTSVDKMNPLNAGKLHNSSKHAGGEVLLGTELFCTSGFGTKTSSGVRGIATAGHCPNSLTDDGHTLSFRGEHQGSYGDFQWHTGPDAEGDDFYRGNSSNTEADMQDISGVDDPFHGQVLCRNGAANHQQCDDVRKLNVCHSFYCNLVQMDTDTSEGGDSGGPYFSGTTAYGITRYGQPLTTGCRGT